MKFANILYNRMESPCSYNFYLHVSSMHDYVWFATSQIHILVTYQHKHFTQLTFVVCSFRPFLRDTLNDSLWALIPQLLKWAHLCTTAIHLTQWDQLRDLVCIVKNLFHCCVAYTMYTVYRITKLDISSEDITCAIAKAVYNHWIWLVAGLYRQTELVNSVLQSSPVQSRPVIVNGPLNANTHV